MPPPAPYSFHGTPLVGPAPAADYRLPLPLRLGRTRCAPPPAPLSVSRYPPFAHRRCSQRKRLSSGPIVASFAW